jgi:hypothetical protein
VLYGCGDDIEYDDLCGFQRDPNNCYREFFIDVGVQCGVPAPQTRPGEFISREMLDNCFLTEGGVITFEPPLDLAGTPGQGTPDPDTGVIQPRHCRSRSSTDMTPCGEIVFESKFDFSVFIQGDPLPENFNADADTLPEDFLGGGRFTVNTAVPFCPEQNVPETTGRAAR